MTAIADEQNRYLSLPHTYSGLRAYRGPVLLPRKRVNGAVNSFMNSIQH